MIEIQHTADTTVPALSPRPIAPALLRGWQCKCPACGRAPLYKSFLKVWPECQSCGEELHHHRADDAPPYFTITIVAHIICAGVLIVEQTYAPPTWVHYLLWLPLLVILCMLLLPRVKGALIGLQWALRMHGFGTELANPVLDAKPSDYP